MVVWDLGHVPRCKACWIAIVAALLLILSTIEIAMEIQLLARVVLVNRLGASLEVVDAVLDRVDATAHRLLTHANTVAQAPPKEQTIVDVAVAF